MANEIKFHVSEAKVRQFSQLTGDLNPLHNDVQFARRTTYRQAIAQGMLIYGHVALLDEFLKKDKIAVPVRMKAQFVEPVFYGQYLSLDIISSSQDDNSDARSIEISIRRMEDGATVLKGYLDIQYAGIEPSEDFRPNSKNNQTSILVRPLSIPRMLRIDDICAGDTEQFQFRLNSTAINTFLGIISQNVVDRKEIEAERIQKHLHVPNLLSAMVLSTSVGMMAPGKFATFLDFDIYCPGKVPIDSVLDFKARIRSVSKSTQMVKKEVSVLLQGEGTADEMMKGHVHAIVNNPPSGAVQMSELAEKAKDLGLRGKVALITGASRGIGETVAKLLALQGVCVAINYYKGIHDANQVVHEIEQYGGRAIAIGADVRDEKQVGEMIAKITEAFGTVHILVNNAVRDFKPSPFEKTGWVDISADIDVIVQGAFNCCKAVLPIMVAQKAGKIINMGTVATEDPPANQAKYVIAKSALVGLTRALSVEYAARNVQVNMVVPHFVATDLVAHIPLPYRQKMEREIPMKRAASTVDVAKTVLFLASGYSDYMTGQKIMVTGGGAPYA